MAESKKTDEKLNKLADKDVRIVYLPPMTVAAVFVMGQNGHDVYEGSGEQQTALALHEFIKRNDLARIKPDMRHFGFNRESNRTNHSYERWITIPGDLAVEPPFEKKRISGGLYAAHAAFPGERWLELYNWGMDNAKYLYDGQRDPLCSHGCLEEHLNVMNLYDRPGGDTGYHLLDLLLPIKEKS